MFLVTGGAIVSACKCRKREHERASQGPYSREAGFPGLRVELQITDSNGGV